MLCRILSEDEITAPLRDQIETLTSRQLLFLEEVIQREKRKRQKEALNQWIIFLQELKEKGLVPADAAGKFDERL